MKWSIAWIALILMGSTSFAAAGRVCSSRLKFDLPLFQTALNNLESFSYVRRALQEAQNRTGSTEYCVSMVAVGSNIYQYLQYHIQIELMARGSVQSSFQFIFQDASVQAFHNVGGQPWVGIDKAHVAQTASEVIRSSQFKMVGSTSTSDNPLYWAQRSQTFMQSQSVMNPETLSAAPLPGSPEVHLVTWMDQLSGNPFAQPGITHGVLVRMASTQVELSENFYVSTDWRYKLEARSNDLRAEMSSDQNEWTRRLLNFSMGAN